MGRMRKIVLRELLALTRSLRVVTGPAFLFFSPALVRVSVMTALMKDCPAAPPIPPTRVTLPRASSPAAQALIPVSTSPRCATNTRIALKLAILIEMKTPVSVEVCALVFRS